MDTSKLIGTSMMFASVGYVFWALRYCDKVYSKVLSAHPELVPEKTGLSVRLGWSSSLGVVAMITDREFLPASASEAIKSLVDRAQTVYWACAIAFVVFVIGMVIA